MSIPYWMREEAIKKLFNYEETHNIPEYNRLTMDPYVDMLDITESSPRKKPYVDIRTVIARVKEL